MDTLPPELLEQILLSIPESRANARLVCRVFNAILAAHMFKTLPAFLDLPRAQATLVDMASRPSSRPRCVWSPYCAAPETLELQDGFLSALYYGVSGRFWHDDRLGRISVDNVVTALGMEEDLTETKLRAMQHKYSLFLSYVYGSMEQYHQHELCVDELCVCLTG
jgi:F-box-like